MTEAQFETACDRVSRIVDPAQFERLRWAREEGPLLDKLVALAHAAIESRGDFELTEEGATSDIKRFTLKIHSNRVVGIALWLEDGQAHLRAEEVSRSPYRLAPGQPRSVAYAGIDAAWMDAGLEDVFGRIGTS
ncbi:MAG: hypothetical protein ACREBO_09675 [Novosphingobium sp.]